MERPGKTWKRGGQRRPIAERFWEKVDRDGPLPEVAPELGQCWIWTASLDGRGYGQIGTGVGKGVVKAYRWAWVDANGDVPEGLELDHLCRVKQCVRPGHLQPVTQRTNNLRSNSASAQRARSTQCPQGHPYDDENTYVDRTRARHCRTCGVEADRRYYPKTRTPERIAALNARRRELYAQKRAGAQ